jgi:hypothetical protein
MIELAPQEFCSAIYGSAHVSRSEVHVVKTVPSGVALTCSPQNRTTQVGGSKTDIGKVSAPDTQIVHSTAIEHTVSDLAIHESQSRQIRRGKIDRLPDCILYPGDAAQNRYVRKRSSHSLDGLRFRNA